MTETAYVPTTWLVVGHGSVGAAIVGRLRQHGVLPAVYDPDPRVPVIVGRRILAIADLPSAQYIVSCVSPRAALSVPSLVDAAMTQETIYLDWNTVAPSVKAEIAAQAACEVVDVGLLDSLDKEGPSRIALSGSAAVTVQPVLEALGFETDVVGTSCGDAALLKFTRSVFMKSLEALVLQHVALAHRLDSSGTVNRSIGANLGEEFVDFARMLVETNRVHAVRRAAELETAVELFAVDGRALPLAGGAVAVLRRAAEIWGTDDAPPADADYEELVAYLARAM
jgi:3-hydroxyisobutyrate dehydrogenase-like beta-hydroxyacid dehydrogenase